MKKYAKENRIVKCIAMVCKNEYNLSDPNDIITMVLKPLHFISIVPILNGENLTQNKKSQTEYTFIAPTAKVLIVDDNFVNLKVAEGLLEKFKVQVTSATGGFEAIDIIMKEQNFDLVLMDHMMPQIDGVDTVKLIRGSNSIYCRKVPIIAFSANAVKEAQLMFLNNGFNDFLAKPIEVKALKQILMKWIPKDKLEKVSGEVAKMQNASSNNQANTNQTFTQNKEAINLKLIDIQAGLNSCMGDKNAYKEILLIFAKSGQKNINLIINSSKMNAIKDFTTYVHSVKSAARSIGAISLSEQSYQLEMAGKSNDWAFINSNLQAYINLYQQVINDIMTNLAPANAAQQTQKRNISGDTFKKALYSISNAVGNYDSDTATKVLKELNACNLPDAFAVKIEECTQAMEDYDYDKVSAIINNILRYI
jgi:CheY-like chemotaxis protein